MSTIAAMREDPLARTLPGRLAWWAGQRPDEIALRYKELGLWCEVTWRAYLEEVEAAARMLWELGCRPGDHVTILSDNRPEWLYVDLAAQGIGARSVGIYQTNPPPDVAYVVDHCQSRILFCEDQEQVDKAVEIREQTPSLDHVVVFDPRGLRDCDDDRLMHWETFEAEGRRLRTADSGWFAERLAERDPAEASMVVYTSGTTGPPKGAMISSRSVLVQADSVVPALGLSARDELLSYLPLCHVAEKIFSLFMPLSTGARVHFGEAIETVQSDLREVAPTVFLGVPRIWEKIHAGATLKMRDSSWLKRTLYDLFVSRGIAIAARRREGRLRLLDRLVWFLGCVLVFWPLRERLGMRRCRIPVTGAAPISPELLEWYHGIGVPVLEGYGMTECGGVSHINWPDRVVLGSVGHTIDGAECRLAGDGEILIHGPVVFNGYLHQEQATRQTIDEEGWLHTGDIGVLDDDGRLRITGRKKEIIITAGGKNLSPEKIENALKTSPYIKEAVAIGDGRKFISALVQIDQDAVGDWATRRKLPFTSHADLAAKSEVVALVEQEVKRANEHLARVESVRTFRILGELLSQDDGTLTPTQKVRRREVHKRYQNLIEEMS